MTTARCSNADRVAASDHPTSAGSSPGRAATKSASRLACAARPAAVGPDTTHGTVPAWPRRGLLPGPAISLVSGGGLLQDDVGVGAAEPERGHPGPPRAARSAASAAASVTSRTAPEAQSTCEDGASTCSVAGTTPRAIAATILMIPATPAAAWVCPMLDFTDPSNTGRSASRP